MQLKQGGQRTNETWLSELRGDIGYEAQLAAHEELGRYLLTVVYRYIENRRQNLDFLQSLDSSEIAELARDFVQETLEKLARNEFALLEQFHHQGRFLNWIAKIAKREAGQELRKAENMRRSAVYVDGNDDENNVRGTRLNLGTSDTRSAENNALLNQLMRTIEKCVNNLADRQRIAFIACVIEEQDTLTVAEWLECSAGGLYILVFNGKKNLRKCLARNGYEEDVLDLFKDEALEY